MRQLQDTVWQRRGVSWLWDGEALGQVAKSEDVWSLRQFLRADGQWPSELPSNHGNAVMVAGLEGCLDLLLPAEAEEWLGAALKDALLSFQSAYEGDAALIFWLPSGRGRININPATDAVTWRCAAPHSHEQIDFGRVLWGEAHEYPQEIVLRQGAQSAGLFHLRIT
jgi:hypothetical protein